MRSDFYYRFELICFRRQTDYLGISQLCCYQSGPFEPYGVRNTTCTSYEVAR